MKTALRKAFESYDGLEVTRKRHLIALLVEHAVVTVGDGVEAPECLIAFTWKNGQTEHLVGWREAQDTRPWTTQEDTILREMWPSGCDFSELRSALLPGRRFHSIRERVFGVSKSMRAKKRPTGWKDRAREAKKTWHAQNPGVLYLRLVGFGEEGMDTEGVMDGAFKTPYCPFFRVGDSPTFWTRRVQTTPPEVSEGVTLAATRSSYRG